MDVVESLIETGHFILRSGLHSNQYVNKYQLFTEPWKLEYMCKDLCDKVNHVKFDYIVGPGTGGFFVAYEMAKMLRVPAIYAEKDFTKGLFWFRTMLPSGKALIVDDVFTTGSSVNGVVELLGDSVEVSAIAVLIDRSERDKKYHRGTPLIKAHRVDIPVWREADCPICAENRVT